jgi:hypothetical protein
MIPYRSVYGSTPQFAVSYQTVGSAPNLQFVNSNHGNLSTVAIAAQHGALAQIRFVANNPGEILTLDSLKWEEPRQTRRHSQRKWIASEFYGMS